jgi:hypothetical protein
MRENKIFNIKRGDTVFYALFAILLGLSVYQDIAWVVKYRFDQSFDIDESGYLAIAVAFAKAKINGGWDGWWHAVSAPLGFAPLLPVVASLTMIVFGVNENFGFVCNIGFAAGTLVLMFVALRRFSPAHGLLASILLVSLANVSMFSRTFQFVSATTFFFFAGFVFFALSDGFRWRSYAILTGASLGCMVLSRTMALAFLPAFAFSFLIYLYLVHGFSRQAVKNIVASILVFLTVALPWYLSNYKSVFGYLFAFGYGAHATEYGHSQGIFTLANLNLRLQMIFVQMRPAHFIIIVPIFFMVFLLRLFGRKRNVADSLILSASVLCLSCFFILSTSQNMGTAFDAPIYPVMIFSVVAWLSGVRLRWIQISYFSLSIALFALAAYAHQDLNRCARMPNKFIKDFAGYGPLVNCGSHVHEYLKLNEFPPVNQPNFILSRDEAVAWRDLNRAIATYLVSEDPNKNSILLISRHMILNVNSIGLEMIKKSDLILPMVQIDPGVLEPTAESYSRWLAQPPQDSACFALMLDDQHGEFFPRADLAVMTSVLAGAQYERVANFATPRPGQHLWIWRKTVAACQRPLVAK